MLSVSSWETTRERLAPNESLTPISRRRTTARASRMLARFEQAINRIIETARMTAKASAISSLCFLGLTPPGETKTPSFARFAGLVRRSAFESTSTSAWAWRAVTCGRSHASTINQCSSGSCSQSP